MSDVIELPTRRKGGGRRWTDQETEYLTANYGRLSIEEMSEALRRPAASITSKANVARVTRHPRWSSEEDTLLRSKYGTMRATEIGRLLGRPEKSVYWRAMKLRLTKPLSEDWTASDDAFLEENHGRLSASEIGDRLNRSRKAVHHRAQALGLTQRISPEALNLMWSMRDQAPPEFFAGQFNVPVRAIERALAHMRAAVVPPAIPEPEVTP